MKILTVAIFCSALVCAAVGFAQAVDESPMFVIVVHPSNVASRLSRDFVAEAFLKKTTRWSDGDVIQPVDLPSASAVRRAFSERVILRSVLAVRSYWQQLIFSGRDVPPPELTSDEEVLKYVAAHAGAIGYVSSKAVSSTVKAVSVK